jgi:hypothetical protein
MSCTMSWARQEPSTPGYTGCYGCGGHDHRHAECMYGETQEREDELKSAGQEVAELVAKLIEERGVDAVRETLRAVSAQGDGGGEQAGAWPHTERGGEAVRDPRKEGNS